jgi:hypothetical protein
MYILICFFVGVACLLLGNFFPPEYHKLIGTVAANAFSLSGLLLIIGAFRRKTVQVVIVDERGKH